MSVFLSGNIILVSRDKKVQIYEIIKNKLKIIQNSHDDIMIYVDIKDENNFIIYSFDKSLKTWIKKENNFKLNHVIKNTHNGELQKVTYLSNGNFISCVYNITIKIWEENNNNYQSISTIKSNDSI